MLLLDFLLVSIVLAGSSGLTINNYVINIENNALRSVKPMRGSSEELNLSGLGLQRIDDSAFENLIDLKILNLANNSLYDLPPFVFANLTALEHLSLVDNSLDRFTDVFAGLGNLKSLNISNNLVKSFQPGELYGLSRSVNIFTLGNSLERICTSLFEKDLKQTSEWFHSEKVKRDVVDDESSFRAKVCIHEGIVKQLDNLRANEPVPSNCREVEIKNYDTSILYLDNLYIAGFKQGWYRIKAPRRHHIRINLRNNNIVRVTRELLNDLPAPVRYVDLTGNKIERLEKGIIENPHLSVLNLTKNYLQEIESGALQMTNITDLYLNDNWLKNIKFMATLPSTIERVYLKKNKISELSEGSNLSLERLSFFYLDGNNITALRRESLQGLSSVVDLGLSDNRITTMEAGSFQDFKSLTYLSLRNNRIAHLNSGVFDGTRNLRFVDIGKNKLTRIRKNSMPHNLSSLLLDFNEIESLESGSFANMPLNQLSLEGNKISVIPKGTFNLPNQNCVREIDRWDLLMGLQHLIQMSFYKNIPSTDESTLKLARSLSHVDLSRNPIKRLENGALCGIRKHKTNWIYVSESPIELIQGGLFDDL